MAQQDACSTPSILYVYHQPDSSSFRYRVLHMIDGLSMLGIEAAWTTPSRLEQMEGQDLRRLLGAAPTIVLVRVRMSPQIAAFIEAARHYGCRILGDIDDRIFSTQEVHMVLEGIDAIDDEAAIAFWYSEVSRIEATLRECDEVTTSTAPLRTALEAHFRKPVTQVFNVSGFDDLKRAQRFRASEAMRVDQPMPVTLGYFSGSPTHRQDFRVALEGIVQTLERHRRARILLVGHIDVPRVFTRFPGRVRVLPPNGVEEYWRTMSYVDIHLAPLRGTPFTDAKSPLKFFEPAHLGKQTVASGSPAFADAIVHGVTGWLCEGDWAQTLDEALEAHCSRVPIGASAMVSASESFTPAALAPVLHALFDVRAQSGSACSD